METNNETKQEQQVSVFCDTLMNVTGAVGNLSKPGDCAIVLCADGKTISSRQKGSYVDNLRMVYSKMINDDKFAELITEATMMYSDHVHENKLPSVAEDDSQENEEEICEILDFN